MAVADETLSRPIHNGSTFNNPWPTWEERSATEFLRWILFKREGSLKAWLEDVKSPTSADWAKAFPVHSPNFAALQKPPVDAVQAIWVGHATLLVQLGGVTFLTDPVMSDRCSPISFMGPKRVVRPSLDLDDPKLPNIDFVVISHNHYDHLDLKSVRQLHARFGASLTWYVPLNLGKWFASCGIKGNVVELDWWQEVQHKHSGVTVALTPAQHWSNRGLDKRHSLWGGYAVFNSKQSFYFAGDTGYCPVFPEIGRKYGPFDLAAIPIGAYEPRWFMNAQHVNPEEAVKIHQEVKSKRSVGIHCCTFALTIEALDEPPKRLVSAAGAASLAEGEFVTLQHGGLIVTADGVDRARGPVLGVAVADSQPAPQLPDAPAAR